MKATLWRGKVDGPGLYLGTPEADYHADPCPEPSLSSHVGKLALNKSLFHAKAAHPRLTAPPEDIDEEEAPKTNYAREIGSAAHSLAFGIGAEVEEIKVKAFTTRESRVLRDEARIAGKIPLKSAHYRIAQDMANIARPVILDLLKGSLVAEAMLTWQERGLWRRGLIDRMSADALTIIDYKTTSASAEPTEASAALYANDYQFQEAFYRRGLRVRGSWSRPRSRRLSGPRSGGWRRGSRGSRRGRRTRRGGTGTCSVRHRRNGGRGAPRYR